MSATLRYSSRLEKTFQQQENAMKIAQSATIVIVSLCFFVLPLVWSGLFNLLPLFPIQNDIFSCNEDIDPWLEMTKLR